jgi:hypothetical protein
MNYYSVRINGASGTFQPYDDIREAWLAREPDAQIEGNGGA